MQFQFLSEIEKGREYRIHVDSIDISEIVAECRDTIKKQPVHPWIDYDDACLDDNIHSDKCWLGMAEYDQPCVRIEAEKAELRLGRLHLRYSLKEYALRPETANGLGLGLSTFDGFASRRLIYDKDTT